MKQVTSDETPEFNKRRSSLDGQTDVLQSRITQIGDEIHGAVLEKQSDEGQIDFINKELVGLRELEEKKLIPVARLYATEIERERLQGVIGGSIAQIAKSNGEIGEYKIQIQQLQQKFEGAWIPARSATRLREADLDVLSKLGKQRLEWRLEPEAFTGREVGREDDLLDFLVGCAVDIEVARQPSA